MNRIILVGNGFDLAHGLKTGYEDFINWYFEQLKKELSDCLSPTFENPLCKLEIDTKYNEYEHWSHFMYIHQYRIRDLKNLKLLEYIQGCSHIVVHKSNLLQRLIMSINSKGWVDIESDYYELLKKLASKLDRNLTFAHDSSERSFDVQENAENVTRLQKTLHFLQEQLVVYLHEMQSKADIKVIQDLDYIIREQIREDDIAVLSRESLSNNIGVLEPELPHETKILDFNYTTTTSKYHTDVIHIHGSLDDPKSIIFGYGDELDEHYKKISNLNDNRYLDNIKSIRYLESGNYRDLLRFINAAPYQIYIMGHSCGNSDRTLLNTLFEHENCVSIKPFYYQKDEEHDNYSVITQNISRNFKDMQSFRDKVVNKTLCEPLPQSAPNLNAEFCG